MSEASRSHDAAGVRGHHFARWVSLMCCVVPLIFCVTLAPWLFGYVERWTQLLAAGVVVAAALIAAVAGGRDCRITMPCLIAMGFVMTGLLQSVPLPSGIAPRVSPEAAAIRTEFYPGHDSRETVPLSLAPAATRQAVALLSVCVLVLLAGFSQFRGRRRFHSLCLLAALNGILMGYAGILFQIRDAGVYGFIPAEGGYFGGFGNRNNAAGFFCMALACSLYLLHDAWLRRSAPESAGRRADWALVLAGTAVLHNAAAVCFTGSRGGIIAMAVTVGSYVMVASRQRPVLRIVLAAVSVLIVAAPAALYLSEMDRADSVGQRLTSLLDSSSMRGELRLQHWQDSAETGLRYAAVGSGLGTYRFVYPLYDTLDIEQVFVHAENIFVEVWVEAGLVGVALLLAGLLATGATAVHGLRYSQGRVVAALLISLMAGTVTSNLFDFGILLFGNALLFCLLLGSALGRLQSGMAGPSTVRRSASRQSAAMPILSGQTAIVLMLVPAGFGLIQLRDATANQTLAAVGSIQTASRRFDIDVEFLLHRAAQAVERSPADAGLRFQLADACVRVVAARCTRDATQQERPNIASFLWALHREALECREFSRPLPFPDSDPRRELLTRALTNYQLAAQNCGLLPDVHRRIAQLSFLDPSSSTELLSLRRHLSLQEGKQRLFYRDGTSCLKQGDAAGALRAFQLCLQRRTVYENAILEMAPRHFTSQQIVEILLPQEPDRLLSAARFYGQATDGPGEELIRLLQQRAASLSTVPVIAALPGG